jgi:hypothetical protein
MFPKPSRIQIKGKTDSRRNQPQNWRIDPINCFPRCYAHELGQKPVIGALVPLLGHVDTSISVKKILCRVPKHGTTKNPAEESGHSSLALDTRVRNVDGAPKLDAVLSFFRLSPTSGSGELFVGAGFFFVSGSSSTASSTTSALCELSHVQGAANAGRC